MTAENIVTAIKNKVNINQNQFIYSDKDIRNFLNACEDVIVDELPKGKTIKLLGLRLKFIEPKPKRCNANISGLEKVVKYKYKISATVTKPLRDFARSFGEKGDY